MENTEVTANPVDGGQRRVNRSQVSSASIKDGLAMHTRDSIVIVFEEMAAAFPDKVAVICGGDSLTYGVLNVQANHLAKHLHELGAGNDSFVAIYLERSTEMLVAMLGILKAGGAYLPI